MLVFIDALAHVIGFVIQLALILLRQVAVVFGHVLLFIVLQALFATLEPARFSRSELTALDAVADPILLVLFALVNLVHPRMTRIDDPWTRSRSIVLLCNRRSDKHQTTDRKDRNADQRDINKDKTDLAKDRADRNKDQRDINKDKVSLAKDRADRNKDRKDINKDKKDLHKDRKDLRKDRKGK